MKYWLFDSEISDTWKDFWLEKWGQDCDDIIIVKGDCPGGSLMGWIKGAHDILHRSKKGDIIFCWFDFQGICCFLLSKLTFRRRHIVSLNVMLKLHRSFKGIIYAFLYKIAFSSRDFYASVTSAEYGNYLNKVFHINRKFPVIHDCWSHKSYKNRYQIKDTDLPSVESNSVFMGGQSSRDWDFAFEVAEAMPDVRFNFVMPDGLYEKYRNRLQSNINLRHGISSKEFYELMYVSSIVMMPIATEAPAGLIVMFYAAVDGKLYITNRTATSCEYITEERGCILPLDIKIWAREIRYYLSHMEEATEKAHRLRLWLETECSGEKYVEGMKKICTEIEKEHPLADRG